MTPLLRRVLVAGAAVAVAVSGQAAYAAFVPVPDTPTQRIAVDNTVRAVVVGDGVAYVGGDFTSATGRNGTFSRNRVAAFDLNTGDVLPFRADANGIVRALALSGSALYVGGDFTTIGGQSRSRLAEVSATTGTVTTAFRANTNGAVRALAAVGDRLYVGGNFGTISGVTQRRLAAVSQTTRALDTTFNPVVDGTVLALTASPDGSRVFAGGAFLTIDGQPRNYLAGLTAGGDLVGPAFANDANYPVLALDANETGSRVYAAIGGSGNQAAAFDTGTGSRLWRQRADGDVQAVTYHGGNVFFGFHEGFGGDPSLRLLAADAGTGQLENAFRPPINSYWGIRALDATERGVLAGGEFTNVKGVDVGRAAFFDAMDGGTPPQVTTLVPAGSAWKYRDNGVEAADWTAAAYDDSAWSQGDAQLGYGDGDEDTIVSFGPSATNKYRTTWFRYRFTWDGSHQANQLVAELLADDGAVLYLNGQEVARDNMPTGAITSTTLAASNRSGGAEGVFRNFTLPTGVLDEGVNTLAVEVHQDAGSSSDLSFDLSLRVQD